MDIDRTQIQECSHIRAIRFVSYGRPPRTAPERGSSNLYAERAEISPGASSLNGFANRRSGLRLLFFAFLAVGLEFHPLVLVQD